MANPYHLIKGYLLTHEEVPEYWEHPKKCFNICFAASRAYNNVPVLDMLEVSKAWAHMQTMMCGHKFITVWLRKVAGIRQGVYDQVLLAAYQHRWLDHLAEEWAHNRLPYQQLRVLSLPPNHINGGPKWV